MALNLSSESHSLQRSSTKTEETKKTSNQSSRAGVNIRKKQSSKKRNDISRSRVGASKISSSTRNKSQNSSNSQSREIIFQNKIRTPKSLLSNNGSIEESKIHKLDNLISGPKAGEDSFGLNVSIGMGLSRSNLNYSNQMGVSGISDSESNDGESNVTIQENKSTQPEVSTRDSGVDAGKPQLKVQETQQVIRLTEQELNEIIKIDLIETDTTEILYIPGVVVQADTEKHVSVSKRNESYEKLLANRDGSDLYVEHHAQTFNYPLKHKSVMTSPPSTNEIACSASAWDIHDSTQQQRGITQSNLRGMRRSSLSVDKKVRKKTDLIEAVDKIVSLTVSSPGCLLQIDNHSEKARHDMSTQVDNNNDGEKNILIKAETAKILNDPNLLRSLKKTEFIIQQNLFHKEQLAYRATLSAEKISEMSVEIDTTTVSSSTTDVEIRSDALLNSTDAKSLDIVDENTSLEMLWAFECPLTTGRNVACITWNKSNPDLLVVGYGDFEFGSSESGLLLFWSLKNPNFPERAIETKSGVASIDFSSTNASLLAVGLYDGTVSIYDVKLSQSTPVLESLHDNGKHSDAVWDVKWVTKGSERGESLVSISADGRVSEWTMKKGLQFTDLLVLKRVNNPTGCSWQPRQTKGEGIIIQQAAGLAFDFPSETQGIYYVGTEDGILHKCSTSYNDNYLESYFGHSGPIYKVQSNPFYNSVILTCSADWTVKLWDTKSFDPKISFQSLELATGVYDICWSPRYSTVFSSVTGDGRVELWDLLSDKNVPCATYQAPMKTLKIEISEPPNKDNASVSSSMNSASDDYGYGGDSKDVLHNQEDVTSNDLQHQEKKIQIKMSCVSFAPSAPVLVAGDNQGSVRVFRINNLEYTPFTKEEQIHNLQNVINHDQHTEAAT